MDKTKPKKISKYTNRRRDVHCWGCNKRIKAGKQYYILCFEHHWSFNTINKTEDIQRRCCQICQEILRDHAGYYNTFELPEFTIGRNCILRDKIKRGYDSIESYYIAIKTGELKLPETRERPSNE